MDLRDPEAFQTVYAAHSRRVYANAYRILGDAAKAEDTVQDVFLRLWLHPDRFDERRGELGSYLAMMARSRALDIARSDSAGARAGERLTAAVEADPPQAERPDERVEARERSTRLRAAVGAPAEAAARGGRARVLGRPARARDRRADGRAARDGAQPPAARHREARARRRSKRHRERSDRLRRRDGA